MYVLENILTIAVFLAAEVFTVSLMIFIIEFMEERDDD